MIISHLIPALLLFGFPIWDFWEARQLRESIHPQVKIWSYLRIITGLWIVSLLVIWRIPLRQLYAAPLVKIPFLSHVPHEAVIGLMIPLILGILLPPFLALVHRGIRQRLLIPYEKMDYLLPNSLLEMALFSGARPYTWPLVGRCKNVVCILKNPNHFIPIERTKRMPGCS